MNKGERCGCSRATSHAKRKQTYDGRKWRNYLWLMLPLLVLLLTPAAPAVPQSKARPPASQYDQMSAMGRLARQVAQARAQQSDGGVGRSFHAPLTKDFPPPGEDGGDQDGPAGGQAELAIAVDATGQHIVVGFNDTRGFTSSPLSVSGFAYSDDGGVSFKDGGQLFATGNPALNGSVGSTLLPQVYGDPDVKYVPGGNGLQFIYSCIMIKGLGTAPSFSGAAQTLCIYRSVDGGHTWQGPFEVTAATNPNGFIFGGNAGDGADKPFIDVHPATGRVLASWSNFTSSGIIPGGIEVSTAYCDNIMTGNPPAWSARSVLNRGSASSDTGSIPRFAGGSSTRAYVAWSRYSPTTFTHYAGWSYNSIGFAYSPDNGVTWTQAVALTPESLPIDYILGNDRVHSFPALAVDQSPGPHQGTVYLAYASNNNRDGADIAFLRSSDGGVTFTPTVFLNSRPGADRAQWFPSLAVDRQTGRVNLMYYDQGIASAGDLTETTWVYSDDGGGTWSWPQPLTTRPFHAGYGNDTGQPNLGDYVEATAQNGVLYAVWAGTTPSVSFVDGQPGTSFTVPDFYLAAVSNAAPPLNLGAPSFTESGGNGFLDPGDTVSLTLPLRNYVTNPLLSPATCTSVSATLATATPGVLVTVPAQAYADIAPGVVQGNPAPFVVQLQPGFVAGTTIEFALSVATSQGNTTLLFSQPTGTPSATTIFTENFNGVAPGSLPAGWSTTHAGGNNVVPWTTTNTVPGAPGGNALFHIEADDGLGGDSTRWERVSTPSIAIPANASYITLDFDIWYDTEDDPDFNILAYDGATLRIADLTTGHLGRLNLAEAFAEELVTGNLPHFPKHTARSNNANYFQDMSIWGGDSGGWQHAHLKLPGMAGTVVQLRWEYTQDISTTGTLIRPTHTFWGVAIDNIVMNSVVFAPPLLVQAALGSGNTVTLSWPAIAGRTYKVQFKDDLNQAGWASLSSVTATGPSGSIVDSTASGQQRWYQVVLLP